MPFFILLAVVIVLLALVVLLLGLKIFFHKSHKFPETSVGHNPEMRKRGLSCARATEIRELTKNKSSDGCKSCSKPVCG